MQATAENILKRTCIWFCLLPQDGEDSMAVTIPLEKPTSSCENQLFVSKTLKTHPKKKLKHALNAVAHLKACHVQARLPIPTQGERNAIQDVPKQDFLHSWDCGPRHLGQLPSLWDWQGPACTPGRSGLLLLLSTAFGEPIRFFPTVQAIKVNSKYPTYYFMFIVHVHGCCSGTKSWFSVKDPWLSHKAREEALERLFCPWAVPTGIYDKSRLLKW